MRLLLVEDNRADAVLLQDLLHNAASGHWEVVWVDRLEKARACLAEEPFDGVLLDLTLPDSQGLPTLQRMQTMAVALPVVVLTGLEDEELAVRAIREGAQDYLVKGSVDGQAVARSIRYAMDRKRLEENLRQSQERFKDLFENSPVAVWEEDLSAVKAELDRLRAAGVDDIGAHLDSRPEMVRQLAGLVRVTAVNRTSAEVFQDADRAAMDGGLTNYLGPEGHPVFRNKLVCLAQGGCNFTAEFPCPMPDGTRKILLLRLFLSATYWESWARVLVSFTDITELKRLQARERETAALEAAARTAQETLDAMGAGILLLDADGRVQSCNRTMATLLGCGQADIVEGSFKDLATRWFSSDERSQLFRMIERARRGWAAPLLRASIVGANEKQLSVLVSATCVRTPDGAPKATILSLQNVTPLHKAEMELGRSHAELQRLTAELLLAEEKERRRIAEALHDEIGQTLAVCNIRLAVLERLVRQRGPSQGLREVRALFDQMTTQIRTLTFDLSPPVLYQLGLQSAVEWLAERHGQQDGLHIEVSADVSPAPFPEATNVLIFQCVRELLANVGKHAQAREVRVHFTQVGECMALIIRDDGKGFDTDRLQAHAQEKHSFGLFSVRERLVHLGGTLDIVSAAGKGTTVSLTVPLPPAPL